MSIPVVANTRARRRTLLLGTGVVVGLYVVFVFTARGRRFDDAAKLYSTIHKFPRRLSRDGVPSPQHAPDAIAAVSLLLLATAMSAWASQRLLPTLRTLMLLILPPVLFCEVLKPILPRPNANDIPSWLGGSTFPSGHSAFVVASGLSIIMLSPPWRRRATAALCAVLTAAIMVAVVVGALHRPSDAIAGAAIAALWILAVSRNYTVNIADEGEPSRRDTWIAVAAFTDFGLVIAYRSAPTHFPPPSWVVDHALIAALLLFAATTLVIDAAIVSYVRQRLIRTTDHWIRDLAPRRRGR